MPGCLGAAILSREGKAQHWKDGLALSSFFTLLEKPPYLEVKVVRDISSIRVEYQGHKKHIFDQAMTVRAF